MPSRVKVLYKYLCEDLSEEGPFPHGWDSQYLKNRSEIRIKLNREYRVLLVLQAPDLIILRIAHRKEVYE